MNILNHIFGLEEVVISNTQKDDLRKTLRDSDIKRIVFFALISAFACIVFLTLSVIAPENILYSHFYFIPDLVLLLVSLYVLTSYLLRKHKKLDKLYCPNCLHILFPLTIIAWSTAILTLKSDMVINAITFFIVLFLISFTLITSHYRFLMYAIVSLSTYSLVLHFTREAFFSQTLYFILIGLTLSFIINWFIQSSRIVSQSAIIKLNQLNSGLESKVKNRARAVEKLNVTLITEIEQRKRAEKELRKALKNVEQSDNLKSEFLANISHEIRTPLNSIIGFTEMMTEDGVDNETKKEYQKLVASNTMYLLSTFDDIFDASLVKTNNFNPVNKRVSVDCFMKVIKYETSGIIIKHNKEHLKFLIEYPEEEISITTDDYLLKKAILRLIDNAFKFTNKGYVKLLAEPQDKSLVFSVEDTGIGIKKADNDKIMLPFVQGDGSFSRGYGGSGLGLNIVGGISKALHWKFDFDSEEGNGSEFRLSLPWDNSQQ